MGSRSFGFFCRSNRIFFSVSKVADWAAAALTELHPVSFLTSRTSVVFFSEQFLARSILAKKESLACGIQAEAACVSRRSTGAVLAIRGTCPDALEVVPAECNSMRLLFWHLDATFSVCSANKNL